MCVYVCSHADMPAVMLNSQHFLSALQPLFLAIQFVFGFVFARNLVATLLMRTVALLNFVHFYI